MNKKKKIINIVSTVLVIGLLIGGTFFLLSKLGVLNGKSDEPRVLRLEAPKNLRYDEATNTFKFDVVEHATNYTITYAGTAFNEIAFKNPTISVESNEVYFVPLYETTVIKVNAEDSTYEYAKSADSATFTLVIKADEGITVSSVNVFVNSMVDDGSLEKVVSMYINDGKLYTDAVFTRFGQTEMYRLKTAFTSPVTNLTEAMDKNNSRSTSITKTYSIPSQDYNSAQSMLDSGDLTGTLKEYKDSGYSISVVRSQTAHTKYDSFSFMIYGTYKVTKGQEIKFLQNLTFVDLNDVSLNEKSNYTTKVADPTQRTLEETSCHEVTEDMATYFSKIENSK